MRLLDHVWRASRKSFALTKMLCLRDGAGDHGRLNDEHHLSLQRSPTPAINSILPVALHRGSGGLSAAALAHRLSNLWRVRFVPAFRSFLSNRARAYLGLCLSVRGYCSQRFRV